MSIIRLAGAGVACLCLCAVGCSTQNKPNAEKAPAKATCCDSGAAAGKTCCTDAKASGKAGACCQDAAAKK